MTIPHTTDTLRTVTIHQPNRIEVRTPDATGRLIAEADRVPFGSWWVVRTNLVPLAERSDGHRVREIEASTRFDAEALLAALYPPALDPVDEAAAQAVTALGIGGAS